MRKRIIWAVLGLLAVIQFIRPAKNQSEGIPDTDISKVYSLPAGIHDVFTNKCYDCHSNNTVYPWYTNIQPVGWWMAFHVKEAKKELNFSDFGDYPRDRANHKLEEITEVLEDGSMPIKSYLWMHDAKVTAEETASITQWITSLGVLKDKE